MDDRNPKRVRNTVVCKITCLKFQRLDSKIE